MVGVLEVFEQLEFIVGLLSQARSSDKEAMALLMIPAHGRQAPGLVFSPVDDRTRVHGDCA